jgi:hypothetical protein
LISHDNSEVNTSSNFEFEPDLEEIQVWDWEICSRLMIWNDFAILPFFDFEKYRTFCKVWRYHFVRNVSDECWTERCLNEYHRNEREFVGMSLTEELRLKWQRMISPAWIVLLKLSHCEQVNSTTLTFWFPLLLLLWMKLKLDDRRIENSMRYQD